MRLLAITVLLLFGAFCQRTEVSVRQSGNSNQAIPISTGYTNRVENALGQEKSDSSVPLNANPTVAINDIEKRCGWLENPTPSNYWFTDADGEWTIGVQGGYQADGIDRIPDFGGQWVKTNINYGYGCLCMDAQVDRKERRVVSIKGASVRSLSACRNDKKLKEPKRE